MFAAVPTALCDLQTTSHDSPRALAINPQSSTVKKAVSGKSTGGSQSFTSSLGSSLAAHGVVSKQNAGKVKTQPGSTVGGGGLSGGDIAGERHNPRLRLARRVSGFHVSVSVFPCQAS